MERRRGHKFWAALICLLAAWGLLFLDQIVALSALSQIPFTVVLVMLFGCGALIATSGVAGRTRAVFAVAIVLLASAIVARELARDDGESAQSNWRSDAGKQIALALHETGDEVSRLQGISASIGDRVRSFVVAGDPAGGLDAIAAFDLLDSLAAETARSDALPLGTVVGIQLLSPDGERLAWAGWPRALEQLDSVLVRSDAELVYSRKVSLYRILSHVIPVTDDGRTVATLLVDMPLEVNYRVNNRFLKSASLADQVSYRSISDISFDYFPVTGNLAQRVSRLRSLRAQAVADRERRIGSLDVNLRAGDGTGPTARDSVLTYYAFPPHIDPVGDVTGDEAAGLRGRAIVYTPQGNPVLGVTIRSHPFRHDHQIRAGRFSLWAKACVVLSLVILFTMLMLRLWNATSPASAWIRGVLWVTFMGSLRYSLLSFGTLTASGGHRIFDPTVFATPALGGVMRSAGDLLITAGFLLVTLYGVFKLARMDITRVEGAPVARRSGATGRHLGVKAVVIAGVATGAFELGRQFVKTVVENSNPRLLGEAMRLTDVEVIVLHLSVFLMVTSILLAGIFLTWAMFHATRTRGAGLTRASLLALLLLAGIAALLQRWELALLSIPLLLFIAWVPKIVRREDLVSVVIVAFCLVIISSGTTYVFLTKDYDGLRKSFVLEKSGELIDPSDNWKVVILEDLLEVYSQRADIRQAVRGWTGPDVHRLAFDLWAEGSLSLLGYSCAIHILDADDQVISEFSVDMPYRARIGGSERIDTPEESEWVVLDQTRSTPQGLVRFYRGILNVRDLSMRSDASVGKVIVDVPFFLESLELAARTGPRTPEVLRNVQEGTVAPRVEEPEALLLARLSGGQIYESSSEELAVGTRLSPDVFERAMDGRWPLLHAGDQNYRVVVRETDDPETFLVAGFAAASVKQHLLNWSTLFSLYLLFAFSLIVLIVLFGLVPVLEPLLPTLTPGRRLGFQQKLLASFLLVALVPAVILGAFAVDFIKGRFVEENKQEALLKAFSARKAFVNILGGELQFFMNQVDVEQLLRPEAAATQTVGDQRIVCLYVDTVDLLQLGAPPVAVSGALHDISPDDLFVTRRGDKRYIGVVSEPLRVSGGGWDGVFYVYYAREIAGDLLGDVAEQVGADVNIYAAGELAGSSREGLLAGGFISAIMNAGAYKKVSMLGSAHSLATEQAGRYRYQVAYLPLTDWGEETPPFEEASADANVSVSALGNTVRAAMSVPLVFRPESYYLQVEKATSIVLGIFALLFTATIALGLFLARGIFEPLRALLAGTRRISDGDFATRIELSRGDEIGTVVNGFNEMASRIAQSQRVLEERRRYLETILQNIGTGVVSLDADDLIRTVNEAGERILGISATSAIGQTVNSLASSGHAPEMFGVLRDAREHGKRFVSDEVELSRGDRKATIKYMLTQLEHEGRYLGSVFVFEDLTELIQSKKLSAWVEMARQIAHEIKNPLTPIRISTQFMMRAYESKTEKFDQIFRESTDTIIKQVDVLKRIASEFSSYGRMQQLELAPYPLDMMIRRIVAPYEKNDMGVTVKFENSVPSRNVMVDAEAVRKICSNLIENAIEAMPNGGELSVSCNEVTENGTERVSIAFRDTGSGLASDIEDRLFEPYFSTKTTGTGLGLAICRTLSREMNGDVTVRNVEDGAGVLAELTLPFA